MIGLLLIGLLLRLRVIDQSLPCGRLLIDRNDAISCVQLKLILCLKTAANAVERGRDEAGEARCLSVNDMNQGMPDRNNPLEATTRRERGSRRKLKIEYNHKGANISGLTALSIPSGHPQ